MDSYSPFVFDDEQVQSWRVRLEMVCQSCPVYQKHPEHCIFQDVHRLEPGDRIAFIQNLPVDILRYAIARHELCMDTEVKRLVTELPAIAAMSSVYARQEMAVC